MRLIFIFLLTFSIGLQAQDLSYLGREYNDTIPQRYRLESNIISDHIYASIPKKLKEDPKKNRRCLMFAQENAIAISDFISGGMLYSDWPELEDYLNRILQRVIPESLKNDTNIHVYISHNGTYNAFMLPSGHIIMNIGFLAEATSESLIAAVLAHELAHFYKQHAVYSYLQAIKSSYGQWHYYQSSHFMKFSIKSETQADSLAMNWMLSSGYSLNGMKLSFETGKLATDNEIARDPKMWEMEEVTHPLDENRLNEVKKFLADHPDHHGNEFQVDSVAFIQFRASARIESLKNLMHTMDYYSCIEKAFKYHLFEPGNAGYMYYLMESIRRQCYLNPILWGQNFITNRYYVRDTVPSSTTKMPMNQSLFKSYNPALLSIPPGDTSQIRTKRYWNGAPDFNSYEQAYVYFYNLSQLQNLHEAVLSNAMSVSHIPAKRDKLLKKYLAFDNIKHREFAEKLLVDSLYSSLDTSRMILLVSFATFIKSGKEVLQISPQPVDSVDHVNEIFRQAMSEFPDYKYQYIPEFSLEHATETRLWFQLYIYSMVHTVSLGEQIELAFVDPVFWEQFKKYNVSTVEFFNCEYADQGGLRRNIDNYRALINEGTTPLFYPPARQRYMRMDLSSLSMIDQGQMKKRHAYSTHFGNRMVSVPEVAKEMADQVRRLDKQKLGEYFLLLDE